MTRSPLPGPLQTVRLRLISSVMLEGERPRSRAIDRADDRLSIARSIELRSALVSLKYFLCLFFPMSHPLSQTGPYGLSS
jgi:hypothetical protein